MLLDPVGILRNMSRTDYAASFFVTEKVVFTYGRSYGNPEVWFLYTSER